MLRTLGIVKGALLTDKQRHFLARRLDGKSVLEWVVRQMTDCQLLNGVVVVADEGKSGEIVGDLTPIDVPVFRTKAKDTMAMLNDTLEQFSTYSCLLIGCDWPFIDPTIFDRLVRAADLQIECDYSAFQFTNEIFSVGRPYGLFPEWYQAATLRKAAKKIDDPIYRNLPGTFFLDNQRNYNVELLPAPAALDRNDIRFSFDDEDDWDNIIELHDALSLDVLDCQKISSLLSNRDMNKKTFIGT
ncbi:MAG: NTP transferase domain-containing protein [Planctomycetaceae bacterium]|jgi:spore coat polysaccharide biosynthesis protein SpsF (cytidylyltransferase family)|nr:NTP transferase domain-containing protein [Planctomycetaceae bacterium]